MSLSCSLLFGCPYHSGSRSVLFPRFTWGPEPIVHVLGLPLRERSRPLPCGTCMLPIPTILFSIPCVLPRVHANSLWRLWFCWKARALARKVDFLCLRPESAEGWQPTGKPLAPLSLWTLAAVSGGQGRSLQRLMQAHRMEETKQSKQVAGEHKAGYPTVMGVGD